MLELWRSKLHAATHRTIEDRLWNQFSLDETEAPLRPV
jgi:hypothetical protein